MCALTLVGFIHLCRKDVTTFRFDDAGMFYRYAWNFRHGYGLAWNAGDRPTFGFTSLPWVFVVLLGSFFSASPTHTLVTLSYLSGVLALGAAAWFASRRATTAFFRRVSYVFPLIALPLLLHPWFEATLGNGMETMLALGTLVLFLESFQRFADQPNAATTVVAAFSGTLCVLTRPELLLCVLLVASLTWLLHLKRQAAVAFFSFCGLLALFVGLDLLINRMYFGTPVPLSFYIKSFRTYYDGYRLYINPLGYNAMFFSIAAPFLLALALLARRCHLKMLAIYLVPACATMLYLAAVDQIMGWRGRYYIPLLALLFVPILKIADEAASAGEMPAWSQSRLLAVAGVLLLISPINERVYGPIGHAMSVSQRVYTPPLFHHQAAGELPFMEWSESCKRFLQVALRLPKGVVLSASEVGMLGGTLPQMRIIDSAGLNDTQLALHGFSNDYLFAQQPDLIWLPHPNYTRLYGALASDPKLLRDYDFYSGVFSHGIAIRKNSSHYAEIKAALQSVFQDAYPDYVFEDYRVQNVTWNADQTRPGTADESVTP